MSGRAEKGSTWVLASLFLSRFASATPSIVIGLLLLEIGQTFGTPVGVTGQMGTASSVMGILAAVVMGALSVGYNHKFLILVGMMVFSVAVFGCGVAPSFMLMMLFYSLIGLSFTVIAPMSFTLVADYFSLERRSTAIGVLVSGSSSSYIVGVPLIIWITGFSGWRSVFLWFIFPLSLTGLIMAKLVLPELEKPHGSPGKQSYLEGFKAIFTDLSASSCLVGTALRSIAFQIPLLYAVSLLREQFHIPRSTASIILIAVALCYTVTSIVTGKFANRLGVKNVTMASVFIASILSIVFTLSRNILLALTAYILSAVFFSMSISSGQNLNLEQMPGYRGTMMSLTEALGSTGSAIGAALGGLVILNYGYEPLGLFLGIFGIAASIVFFTLTKEPINSVTE